MKILITIDHFVHSLTHSHYALRLKSNETLSSTISTLSADVSERATLHKVHLQNFGDGGVQEKLKKHANRRKLLDMAKAQGEEINVLREEVERKSVVM